jgi:large repetitive protein
VNVTDSLGAVVSKTFTISVNPPLLITPTVPAGTAGIAYNDTLTVTGGGVPYTSITISNYSGGGTGLALGNITTNAASGTVRINGTPTAAGTITFTVNVVDAIGATLHRTYTLTIKPGLTITSSLPGGAVGTSYHHTITVSGGSTPYTLSVTSFSAGSTGLTTAAISVNASAGTVVVNGTPSAVGTLAFVVNASDASGGRVSQAFSIAISAHPTIGGLSATQWTADKAGFSGVSTISGGTAPFSIAGVTGLPTGLSAAISGSTLHVTGTPTVTGTYSASVTIHDAAGVSAAQTFRIVINPAPSIANPATMQWTVGTPNVSAVLTLGGGTGGFIIAGSSGLPPGLQVALTGDTIHFTGTPTATGAYAGSVTVRDAIGAAVTKTFTITINAAPTVGSLTTAQWTLGKAGFTGVLPVAAGTAPFAIASATGLPPGLTAVVSGNAIRFTGTPSATGTYAGSIIIHDAAGASVSRAFTITINAPLQITTTSVPSPMMGALYSALVSGRGGTGAVSYAIAAGSLPPGLKLSRTGAITGASRGAGSFTFTIIATDAVGATTSRTYTMSLVW